jgi:asparagine synthase (glutamine-hydrolysing)
MQTRIGGMLATLVHRGPDDGGVWSGDRVGLGHRRLSVIDLSTAAHQPMGTEDGLVQIVFNGEIYNFQELRAQLEKAGYAFRSHSDTEVILQGYRCWGKEVFGRLRGMFALAIWDGANGELVLARDRVGKKPLFYGWHDGALLFASEIKAILAARMPQQPDLQAIHHYLTYQYVRHPGRHSRESAKFRRRPTWSSVRTATPRRYPTGRCPRPPEPARGPYPP